MKCILCKSKNINNIETINAYEVISLYKRAFNIDISNIIKSDLLYHHCNNCDLLFFTLQDGEIPTGDNSFYNALNKLEWYYMSEKNEYHFAKNLIRDDAKVLEVGCGKAAFSKFITNKNNYIGLEFSSDAKEMAAKNGINIQNTSIEEYSKYNQGKFDISCSFQVLEHTSNPHSFIQSQIKCLHRGGQQHSLLIIAVPSEDSFISKCTNGILNMPPHHISRFSDKCLKQIEKIFNIELLEIYHEKLQNEHIDFYKSTQWANIFLKPKMIDISIKRKIINKLGIFGKRFIKIKPNIYGHTVIAVYKIK